MEYRRLARTEIDVSPVAFGPLRFLKGPDGMAGARRALHLALDAGISAVHSSHQYGSYPALVDLLSRHPRRADVRHIIKVPCPDYGQRRFDSAEFTQSVDRALSDFDVEQIAVVQHLHRGPALEPEVYGAKGDRMRARSALDVTHDVMDEVGRLKSQGKVATVGCYPHTLGYLDRVFDLGFDSIVHPFGPLEPELESSFERIADADMSVIALRPLLQGLVTDRAADRGRLPDGDPLLREQWDRWYQRLSALRSAMGAGPESWTRFAIRFSITPRVVSTTVIGLDSVDQVQTAIHAAEEGPLSEQLIATAVEVTTQTGPIAVSTLAPPAPTSIRMLAGSIKRRLLRAVSALG